MARVPKEIVRTEYIDVTADEVKAVIEGIAKAVDGMVHDFGFNMSVMDQIAQLMHKSPPDMEMVRIMVNKVLTAYGRGYLERQIQDALADNRMLYVDKKRSHTVSGGTNKRLVSGRNIDFKNNIDNFWANVNLEQFFDVYVPDSDKESD